MDTTLTHSGDNINQQITETVARESVRLRNFIARRVPNRADADDVMQDVFAELVQAWHLPEPIEQVGAWLFRVARNRIVDRFRKKKELPLPVAAEDDEDSTWFETLLADQHGGPEAEFARSVLLDAVEEALAELPAAQREVFIAHEIEGRSFKELAAETGVNVNTLLARKRYAVLHLRERLQVVMDELET
jgi:RNA polymerase sigma factor (sigma-70 family)